jgi:hypothetical protein
MMVIDEDRETNGTLQSKGNDLSLIPLENSLIVPNNSLFRQNKFPVPSNCNSESKGEKLL